MAFGRKVHDDVGLLLLKNAVNGLAVADVGLDEAELRIVHHALQRGQVARIGQLVHADHPVFRMLLQVIINIMTGIISPLVWSMYADVADYSELKDGTASTGLIFSSASMAQKFGGAFGGSAVMWMLAAFGYNTAAGAVQTETAILGLRILMSWVPAIVAGLAILVVWFYPLTKKKMEGVQVELAAKRGACNPGAAGL